MNIIFIAPPAAGKGTYSDLLATNYGYQHISTGDLLRNEIKSGSKLGIEIKNIIDKGELVSDEIITEMLKNTLNNLKDKKFILDGYPRNKEQAIILTELFQELNIGNYTVIYLNVDKEIATKRALGRIVCETCGSTYNNYFKEQSPQKEGVCDKCHGKLICRSDDTEETFNKRFDTYLNVTSPVIDYYKGIKRLQIVDSNSGAKEAFSAIERIINDHN